jgi:aryl-alcohol dehydrogenase-like predicted oxidoreductase
MKFLNLKQNNDNLHLSKIVLGTDYFGTTVPEETAFRLLDNYIDAGGNCIDTARVYASWLPGGEDASEATIGRWLKSRGIRNNVILSTKGGHPPLDNMNNGRLSRKEIEGDLDKSLRILGINEVDIYWLHRDDTTRPVEDIMETVSMLIAKGKVRTVGCSNWKTERIEAANRAAASDGRTIGSQGIIIESGSQTAGSRGIIAVSGSQTEGSAVHAQFSVSQIQWSLATSTPEAHSDPTIVCMSEKEYCWYEKENFPVFAFSSQAKGFFTRALALGLEAINKKSMERFCTPENIARLERVKEYAAKTGLTPTAIALGYILCNRVPAVAIVGCKNTEQLADSLTASDVDLPDTVADWLFKG